MPTREELQDHMRPVFIEHNQRELVKEFADANGMSVSEVIAEAMAGFVSGDYPQRKRVLERVTAWIKPELYAQFTKKARSSHLTIRDAVAIALDERLK